MHQCMQCNRKFGDEDRTILSGCVCGSKIFLYLRNNLNVFNGNGNSFKVEAKHRNGHAKLEEQKVAAETKLDAIELPVKLSKVQRKKRRTESFDIIKVQAGVYKLNLDSLMQKKEFTITEGKRARPNVRNLVEIMN